MSFILLFNTLIAVKPTLVALASSDLHKSMKLIREEANKSNYFSKIYSYNEKSPIVREFYNNVSGVSLQDRGKGYWMWKIPIIENVLGQVATGDYVIYMDVGCKMSHILVNDQREIP